MKLNFGAAGSKHDKQQQNSMWEATLFTRISIADYGGGGGCGKL